MVTTCSLHTKLPLFLHLLPHRLQSYMLTRETTRETWLASVYNKLLTSSPINTKSKYYPHVWTPLSTKKRIKPVPHELQNTISQRALQLTLAQIPLAQAPPLLHPLHVYVFCKPPVVNHVQHHVLPCPLRNVWRALCLPTMRHRQRPTGNHTITKRSHKKLVYPIRERYFDMESSAPNTN